MTPRENITSIFHRKGFERVPVQFSLCPSQVEKFREMTGAEDYAEYFEFPWRGLPQPDLKNQMAEYIKDRWSEYYDEPYLEGTKITIYGVAHQPGGEAAMHMTRMLHPMAKFTSLEQMQAYPYPDYASADTGAIAGEVKKLHSQGLLALGGGGSIWESSWYIRSMEQLMIDMMTDDPMASYHLDRITENVCVNAKAFAKAGADMIHFGDDVGMQQSLMMSAELYRKWIKPRFAGVIKAVKDINPDVIVSYHSCGYVTPLIDDFIEAGIDVLNPVQPECMDFAEIHEKFGDRVSFWGTVGTQTTMPFGSPEDVKKCVHRNLKIAGEKGGLLCAPTHLVEPEVPWKNIMAYVEACREFSL
ncbi:MAG: hypothetical protein A2017_09500 [Lentisphaerae bacterium GWF2_44_16]|nr:MAG: hypothetical protein A2017_09500 [Lentisphaerae bacterium GWF2_44_16]